MILNLIVEIDTVEGIIFEEIAEGSDLILSAERSIPPFTGFNVENIFKRDFPICHKIVGQSLILNFNNMERLREEVKKELEMVDYCKDECLPLLLGRIKTISGIQMLENKLKQLK